VFDPNIWAAVPFHFWSVVFFVLGSLVGSFLNVCIHRMPIGESVISPPSHCPQCRYSIPWYLNIPLVTWIYLRARCANCGKPIPARYVLVELLTACVFLCCWLVYGHVSAPVALAYCTLLAGFIAATFIDMEHFIIPDEITLGGIGVGFLLSLLVPALHGVATSSRALEASFLGILAGAAIVYGIVRAGKLLFGRQRCSLPPGTRVVFTETALVLPDQRIPYEELFYRRTDTVRFKACRLELVDRGYAEVDVALNPKTLRVGPDEFETETVAHLEATTNELVLPREAMGFGDVKFMAAIGAFLGWEAVVFSLMVSSTIGALVGVGLIASGKQEWSSRLPYGPYIALAAALWVFGGKSLWMAWTRLG
jgi:leader peptidase (prepilin peptidase)/N-methyltransferase